MNLDQKDLYDGLSHAAWGYFFLTFDFNLNTVSILPRFVGFCLLLSAITRLSGARRDLALLRPLCILLAGWNAIDWLLSWMGQDLDGRILFLDLLVAAAGLYFHYQFLTDMAALAEQFQPDGSELSGKICCRRTAYIVLITITALLMDLPAGLLGDGQEWIILCVMAVACVAALLIITAMFSLRKCLAPLEPHE